MKLTLEQYHSMIKTRSIGFIGVGVSHRELIRQYAAAGARLTVRDRRSLEELGDFGRELTQMGVRLMLGADYLRDITEEVLFRTPGMKFYTPELTEARRRGVAVTSELELFLALCPCPVYGITGSDGKTTSTTLIAELLRRSGRTVHLGGNIGAPLLPVIDQVKPEDAAVVELSSFQLISMRQSPDVAVVTNVSPNHLDIHKDMDEYVQAKKNVFLHQNAFGRAVFNADNDITRSFLPEARGQALAFSRREKTNGAWVDEKGDIYMGDTFVMNAKEIRIPGLHNVENYLAAISAVWGEVSPETIRQVAATFPGVAHRAELVRVLDGVSYYNDSIASSPTRTIKGMLSLFPQKILLIAGGYDKHIPYDPMGPAVVEKVKTLVLLGATGPKIEAAVKAAPGYREGCPEILHASSMEEAVSLARQHASAGDIVSLSPASASFDLYKDFEARGNDFKRIVMDLT